MPGCFKCGAHADVKINILEYCNLCFLAIFESKIRKSLPKLDSSASILLYLTEPRLVHIALEQLSKIVENRQFRRLDVCCPVPVEHVNWRRIEMPFPPQCEHRFKREDSELIQHCTQNGYTLLLHAETLEEVIAGSMALVCEGRGAAAAEYCSRSAYGPVTMINIFETIKKKEIAHYLHLRGWEGAEREEDRTREGQIRATLSRFMSELDEKNELAIFNVKNTLKKLYKL